jgi:hypothetical protein
VSARRLAALLALPCSLLACEGGAEAAARKSAALVARAIEVLRNAPNDAKAGRLTELRALDCSGPDVCATRDVCVAAYAKHVDALALIQAAKQRLSEGKTPQANRFLMSAQTALGEASAAVSGCTEREGLLRHRYKL